MASTNDEEDRPQWSGCGESNTEDDKNISTEKYKMDSSEDSPPITAHLYQPLANSADDEFKGQEETLSSPGHFYRGEVLNALPSPSFSPTPSGDDEEHSGSPLSDVGSFMSGSIPTFPESDDSWSAPSSSSSSSSSPYSSPASSSSLSTPSSLPPSSSSSSSSSFLSSSFSSSSCSSPSASPPFTSPSPSPSPTLTSSSSVHNSCDEQEVCTDDDNIYLTTIQNGQTIKRHT